MATLLPGVGQARRLTYTVPGKQPLPLHTGPYAARSPGWNWGIYKAKTAFPLSFPRLTTPCGYDSPVKPKKENKHVDLNHTCRNPPGQRT